MMSIFTVILNAIGKVFPILLKLLGPILTPILVVLGLGWTLSSSVGKALYTSTIIFSILVGSGICFYFVMKGISFFIRSK